MKQLSHGAGTGIRSAIFGLAGAVEAFLRFEVIDVVDDHKIKPAIPIIIKECGGNSPVRIFDSGLLRDLAKRSVALV